MYCSCRSGSFSDDKTTSTRCCWVFLIQFRNQWMQLLSFDRESLYQIYSPYSAFSYFQLTMLSKTYWGVLKFFQQAEEVMKYRHLLGQKAKDLLDELRNITSLYKPVVEESYDKTSSLMAEAGSQDRVVEVSYGASRSKEYSSQCWCHNSNEQGHILQEFEQCNFQRLEWKTFETCMHSSSALGFDSFVLVCLATPFIHCYW